MGCLRRVSLSRVSKGYSVALRRRVEELKPEREFYEEMVVKVRGTLCRWDH